MAIKSILTIHMPTEPIDTVNPVINFVKMLNAHLDIVVFCVPSPVSSIISTDSARYQWSTGFYQQLEDTDTRVHELKNLFIENGISGNAVTECQELTHVDETMRAYSFYSDLVVFENKATIEKGVAAQAFNGILFNSGVPVLILGSDTESQISFKRILIAWNSVPEAAKAIRHCLPLIKDANELQIAVVDTDPVTSDSRTAVSLASYLTRHGHTATVVHLPDARQNVAGALIKHAAKMNADLVVMGGYGHSRFHEWLLGGTTKRMLSELNIPLLIAH